jgi:ribosome-associated translation inhibitor RaiA
MPENIRSDDSEISLREYIEARLDSLEKHFDSRFEAAQTAIDKAETTMNDRLGGMNEFRDTLRDQASRFATLLQLDEKMTAVIKLEERLRDLEKASVSRDIVDDLRGRVEHAATRSELESTLQGRATRFAAAEDRLGKLESFQSNLQGRMWAMGALIFFGALVINLVLRFMFQARGQ